MIQTSKKSRPPACDACKARKVLCLRQPNGMPCPRCVEKKILCKTTPLPRGRPRKNPPTFTAAPTTNESSAGPEYLTESVLSEQSSGDGAALQRRPNLNLSLRELSPDLVQHLFECFTHSFCPRLPVFWRINLAATLSSAGWNIDLLPPDARVLAYCICAQASLTSFHPSIIGTGPKPDSLMDRSVLFFGADLRMYGVRRAGVCKAFLQQAVDLACEARIHLRVSDYSAASCFILGNLDESPSRPWTVAYMSHVRCLANNRDQGIEEDEKATWAAFLMMEAVQGILERKPIVLTRADQFLLTGPEPLPLNQILESLRPMVQAPSKKAATRMLFIAVRPILFHVVRLCLELHEKIAGVPARREPIAETVVIDFLSRLAILQSIVSLLFTQINWTIEPQLLRSHPPFSSDEDEVRNCTCAIVIGFTGLVIALHREIDYRAGTPNISSDGNQLQDRWTLERTAFLRSQVHAMASAVVDDVARLLMLSPFPPDPLLINCAGIFPWVHFCLDEADAAGGLLPDRLVAFECILNMLKALGYSRDSPESHSLIQHMEAHVAARKAMDLLPTLNLASSDMTFPVDETWERMFPLDFGVLDGDV